MAEMAAEMLLRLHCSALTQVPILSLFVITLT